MTKSHFGVARLPISQAVRAGDQVFVSGQAPVLEDGSVVAGGIKAQLEQSMANVAAALALAGAALEDVVKITLILADVRDLDAVNRLYASYFPESPPVRTTFEARLRIDVRIQIDAVAYKPL